MSIFTKDDFYEFNGKENELCIMLENIHCMDETAQHKMMIYVGGTDHHNKSSRMKVYITGGANKGYEFYIPIKLIKFDKNNKLTRDSLEGLDKYPTKLKKEYLNMLSDMLFKLKDKFIDRFDGIITEDELIELIRKECPNIRFKK